MSETKIKKIVESNITSLDVLSRQKQMNEIIKKKYNLSCFSFFYAKSGCGNFFTMMDYTKYNTNCLFGSFEIKGAFVNLMKFMKFLKDECNMKLDFQEKKLTENIFQLSFDCNYPKFLLISEKLKKT